MHRIMVVDDEVVITMQLEENLSTMGYEFAGKASSGKNAVNMAKRLMPDLILMDIVMPGELDGIDAAKIIKAELGIPVVFLTAYTDDEFVNRAKYVEPFGYILKPFHAGQVKASVEIALFKKDLEEALLKAHDDLVRRIEECTAGLLVINKELEQEIQGRNQVEEMLRQGKKELELKTRDLEEANTALKVLLKRRDENGAELEENVLSNVKELVVPYIERLKKSGLNNRQEGYVNRLESYLNEVVSPFLTKLSSEYLSLTPTEIQVADLVKRGKTSKEIAELTGSTTRAIEFHRKGLRKKLGLTNRKTNLKSYLLSLSQ